ncbi:MAG: YcxB family protein [Rhodospirillaceae bacterium]|nr:YcxB family protein [Rhodospirillaceae bacterium]
MSFAETRIKFKRWSTQSKSRFVLIHGSVFGIVLFIPPIFLLPWNSFTHFLRFALGAFPICIFCGWLFGIAGWYVLEPYNKVLEAQAKRDKKLSDGSRALTVRSNARFSESIVDRVSLRFGPLPWRDRFAMVMAILFATPLRTIRTIYLTIVAVAFVVILVIPIRRFVFSSVWTDVPIIILVGIPVIMLGWSLIVGGLVLVTGRSMNTIHFTSNGIEWSGDERMPASFQWKRISSVKETRRHMFIFLDRRLLLNPIPKSAITSPDKIGSLRSIFRQMCSEECTLELQS